LLHFRLRAGLTQEALAEDAQPQLSWRTISNLERGVNKASRLDTVARLADALQLSGAERAAFVAAARPDSALLRDVQRRQRHNLPVQPTALIGRQREVAAVRERLLEPQTRLLTVTGPGGVGKTRLALQVAAEVLESFPDGVYFVNLAPLSDPQLVLPTIAQALAVTEAGGQPLCDTLHGFLQDKRLLLVLDNFVQVMDAAPAVSELLAACAQVRVLVTSRDPLHLRGERLSAVPPLALPDLTPPPPLERLTQYEAVRLFIARAQDAKPDFAVTNEVAPAVAQICVCLDGLPLAIELAAARVRMLPPQALLTRLSHRLRQQTLRATLDWSYSLLTEAEQRLFARLGVFVGGCTLEAVEAVCNLEGAPPAAPSGGAVPIRAGAGAERR
jgi:hypothetical protein